MALTAEITNVVKAPDGTFEVTYDFMEDISDGVRGAVATHTQGFPAETDRATVEEAIQNYARDILPSVRATPPVVVGDSIAIPDA